MLHAVHLRTAFCMQASFTSILHASIIDEHSACLHHPCASTGAYDPAAAPHMAGPYDPTPQMPYQGVYEPQPAMAYAPLPASGLLTTEPDGSNRIQLAIVGPQVGAVLGRNGANISQIRAVRLTVGCLWLWAVGSGCCILWRYCLPT